MSGYYWWTTGTMFGQDGVEYLWSNLVYSPADSYFTRVMSSELYSQYTAEKPFGFSLRCVNPRCSPAGSSAARSYPVSLVLSGNYFWSSGTASSQNAYGDWWSSWARQDDSALSYSLDVSASRPVPQYTYFKYVGFALRCVNITALPYRL